MTIGELPFELWDDLERCPRALTKYKFLLDRARRRAVNERVQHLVTSTNKSLELILYSLPIGASAKIETPETESVKAAIAEIEALLGDTIERTGRWGDLHRHLRFSETHDWRDIAGSDWPSVCNDIQATFESGVDPIPVPEIDLGACSSKPLPGSISPNLDWSRITSDDFERLLQKLFKKFPSYKNVELLMKHNAPDRGRDLTAQRVITDDGGTTRFENVLIQAKHWQSKSVRTIDIQEAIAATKLWTPTKFHALIFATSGRFTADALSYVDTHNAAVNVPFVDLWPDNRLEELLAEHPDLIAEFRLRATV